MAFATNIVYTLVLIADIDMRSRTILSELDFCDGRIVLCFSVSNSVIFCLRESDFLKRLYLFI